MKKRLGSFPFIALISLIPTLLIWLPFFFHLESFWHVPLARDGMATVVANYDGPLYIVVAKTFYNAQAIQENFSFPLPAQYYAAHFPLYPALIRLLGFATNYPYAMLLVTVFSSVFSIYMFYKLALMYLKKNDALWLATIFALFPARWLIVRSVGSSEPLFVGSIIASIYFFKNKNYWLAGIFGAVAQLTKSPGILLFVSYVFAIFVPEVKRLATTNSSKWLKTFNYRVFPVTLIPIALVAVFGFYWIQYGDLLAYFHSGDNIHLSFPPFQIFNYNAPWVNTHWLEEVIFIYMLSIIGLIQLIKQGESTLYWFVGIFFTSLIFVSHRDILRYALPIVPFLIIAYRDYLIRKEFKITFAFLIIPIYLISLAFISQNVMPIANWSSLL